jgi:hypothetical protein
MCDCYNDGEEFMDVQLEEKKLDAEPIALPVTVARRTKK